MNRTNIYLTDEQRDRLDQRARAEGMSRAELIRLILDRDLFGDQERLAADLAAIDESFGVLAGEHLELDRGDDDRAAHLDRVVNL
ncbi:MAG: ribbon-helix-helix domain-containing protein [Actinomycetota bacterium]|nr:ribbon-helix-helix domain-containing protein [Actinomycetota bacterium]